MRSISARQASPGILKSDVKMTSRLPVTAKGIAPKMDLPVEHDEIMEKIVALYKDLFFHNGYGEIRIGMRFLKRGQKEIIIHCGKDYRYVVDYPTAKQTRGPQKTVRQGAYAGERG
jgi:hypothetical protein